VRPQIEVPPLPPRGREHPLQKPPESSQPGCPFAPAVPPAATPGIDAPSTPPPPRPATTVDRRTTNPLLNVAKIP
jgi:hypothetical protein